MGIRGASRWLVAVALVAGVGCSSAVPTSSPTSGPVGSTGESIVSPTATDASVMATDLTSGTVTSTTDDSTTDESTTASVDSTATSDDSTSVTSDDSTTVPSASTLPTTTVAGPIGPTSPTAPCSMAPSGAYGEITWVEGGRLLATGDGVSSTCLADGVTSTTPTQWSPTGESALVDPATVVGPSTTRPSGFAADDASVSWSQPTGKALIDVDPATHRLLWHSATSGQTEDISFLQRTDLAVYHPAGKAIAAVGVDENGQYGIWLASNRGENRKLITSIDDPTTPATDLAFSSDGRSLYFIHGFLHQLDLFGLLLDEIGQPDRGEADITASTVESHFAITAGGCDAAGTILAYGPTGEINLRAAADSPFHDGRTIQPIGWLAGGRLVVAARAQGCSGPADVWTWTVTTGAFRQIGAGWDAVAVRIPRGTFVELPDAIEQAAPG